jgi:hypothetical protein
MYEKKEEAKEYQVLMVGGLRHHINLQSSVKVLAQLYMGII